MIENNFDIVRGYDKYSIAALLKIKACSKNISTRFCLLAAICTFDSIIFSLINSAL